MRVKDSSVFFEYFYDKKDHHKLGGFFSHISHDE